MLGFALADNSTFRGGFVVYMLYTIDMNPKTVELLEFIDSNPYLSPEDIIQELYGKHTTKKMAIDTILAEMNADDRIKVVQILNSIGYDDIL